MGSYYSKDDISFNSMFPIIPVWIANTAGALWIVYMIWKKGKFKQIKEDFSDSTFLMTIALSIIILFFTNDENKYRSKEANRNAILAAIAAYFGNLNLWFASFMIGGAFIYYTWDEKQQRDLQIQWGFNPAPKHTPKNQNLHYIGQGWNKAKQIY